VRGRRVYGGTRQYRPLRINQAGVIRYFRQQPADVPGMLFNMMTKWPMSESWASFSTTWPRCFSRGTAVTYTCCTSADLFLLLLLDGHHVQPKEMSEEPEGLWHVHSGIGRENARRITWKVMVRITYVGAGFWPWWPLCDDHFGIARCELRRASFYGGTGLLIAVSVAFDLVQKIDSHLVMRNYRGLLES